MNIQSHTDLKALYRVTGTPENFLTALRYNIWGFNAENEHQWRKLMPGDLIFFHSKGSDSRFITQPRPSILGFGIVSDNFFKDNTPLWIDEKLEGKSYPYRFSFSEIYLFAHIQISDDWDSTTLEKFELTHKIVEKLLEPGIPLGELGGFPHMGSYSSIKNPNIKKALLGSPRKLNFYDGEHFEDLITKSSEMTIVGSPTEFLRYSTTMTVFEDIKQKIISEQRTTHERSTQKLAKAEKLHFEILSFFLDFLKNRGFNIMCNNHVDMYAYKQNTSLLIEAKSLEKKNFVSQSRKGLAQLFEYNYFDISDFKKKQGLFFSREIKLLATSEKPSNDAYVAFINSLNINTIAVKNGSVIEYGNSIKLEEV